MNSVVHDPVARANVLEFQGDMSLATRNRQAMQDVAEGLRLWPLACSLGWLDIRLRYRGSLLGPFWLTLSTAVMVASLGVLYSALFHIDIHEYLPFLALSQVLWHVPQHAGERGLHLLHPGRGHDPRGAHAAVPARAAHAGAQRAGAGAQRRRDRRGLS